MNSKNTKSIGKQIKMLRKATGLTQEQLATRTNISLSAIGKYEIGERMPKYETLSDIATALGVRVEDLTGSTINIEMHESKKISPQGEKITNTLDALGQAINSTIRIYQLGGDTNDLWLKLTDKLLEDITEFTDFLSSAVNNIIPEKFMDGYPKISIDEENKKINEMQEKYSKIPRQLINIYMDLNKIVLHTQNLTDNIVKNMKSNNTTDKK